MNIWKGFHVSSNTSFSFGRTDLFLRSVVALLVLSTTLCVNFTSLASGAITTIQTTTTPAVPLSYTKSGDTYHWGQDDNLHLTGFLFDSNNDGEAERFIPRLTTQNVAVLRRDNNSSTSRRCSIFAEIHANSYSYKPSLPLLNGHENNPPAGESNCDIAAILASDVINIGVLDTFSNLHDSANNIERIDYIFMPGIIAPEDELLSRTGHITTEKAGARNTIKIAAITAIDDLGNPAAFGELISAGPDGQIQPGRTNISTDYALLRNEPHSPQGYPVLALTTRETLLATFITLDDLGLSPGQEYYGFSFFSTDVDPLIHSLTDISTFPANTPQHGGINHGDADLYGGSAALYMRDGDLLNSAPIAINDGAITAFETPVTIAALANDSDSDGDDLTVSSAGPSSLGSGVFINIDQSITYTPVPGFSGTETFSYVISDGNGGVATASITVIVSDPFPDFDNDGITDNIDIDDDNDGIIDTAEGDSDFDSDGIPNRLDLDSDGDGILDLEESGLSESLQSQLDTDGDGQVDPGNSVGNNGLADDVETAIDSGQVDYDSDGQADSVFDTDADNSPDFLDLDTDADGISDVIEAGLNDTDDDGMMDAGQTPTISPPDTDGDGIDDYRDPATGSGDNPDDPNPGRLESGLEGHGGSMSMILLCVLFFLGLFRHYRTLTSMRLGAVIVSMSLLLISIPAVASKNDDDRQFDRRFYLGAGLGISQLKPRSTNNFYKVDEENDTVGNVFFGYDISKHISLEAYYSDLGEAGIANSATGAHSGEYGYQHYGITALGYLFNSRDSSDYDFSDDDKEGFYRREGLSLYARIGVGVMENDSNLSFTTLKNGDVHVGGGLEYGFSNGFATRLELVSFDKDAKQLTIGLLKRFGNVSKPLPKPVIVVETSTLPPKPQPAQEMSVILPVVHFAFDESYLTHAEKQKLSLLATVLKDSAKLMLTVRGHTDSVGSKEYNQKLSERRANEVKDYLISHGARHEQLNVTGYGETQPVATNATAAGRSQNRRTDFNNNNSKVDFILKQQ